MIKLGVSLDLCRTLSDNLGKKIGLQYKHDDSSIILLNKKYI